MRRDGGRMQAVTVVGVIVLAIAAFAGARGRRRGHRLDPVPARVPGGARPVRVLDRVGQTARRLAGPDPQARGDRPRHPDRVRPARDRAAAGPPAPAAATVAAIIVVGSGLVLVAAAFNGGARWFILPALSLGLAAAFVTAAGIDLDGGVGRKDYRPATVAEVHDKYEIGIGELIVDLRSADLPAGRHPHRDGCRRRQRRARRAANVCVNVNATAGMGAISLFDRELGRHRRRLRRRARPPSGTPRIDPRRRRRTRRARGPAHATHEPRTRLASVDRRRRLRHDEAGGNDACIGGSAGAGRGWSAGLGPTSRRSSPGWRCWSLGGRAPARLAGRDRAPLRRRRPDRLCRGRGDPAGERARAARLSRCHHESTMSSQPSASAGRGAGRRPPRRDARASCAATASTSSSAGVCSGLARELGIDPLIVRVAFIAAALAGGVGVAVYVLAWVFLPAGPAAHDGPWVSRLRDRPGVDRGRRSAPACCCSRCCSRSARSGSGSPTRSSGRSVLVTAGGALIWRQSLGGHETRQARGRRTPRRRRRLHAARAPTSRAPGSASRS